MARRWAPRGHVGAPRHPGPPYDPYGYEPHYPKYPRYPYDYDDEYYDDYYYCDPPPHQLFSRRERPPGYIPSGPRGGLPPPYSHAWSGAPGPSRAPYMRHPPQRPMLPYPAANKSWQANQRRPEEAREMAKPKTRKPHPSFVSLKPWNKEDAEKALAAEMEFSKALMVKFPEQKITQAMVSGLSPAIGEVVHLHIPTNGRYCFVKVKEGEDVKKLMETLNATDFYGQGNLRCDTIPGELDNSAIVDPYTLYLGNLPASTIASSDLKEKFPTSQRIDIRKVQSHGRCYAFIGFETVENAIDAFRSALNLSFDSRTLVRFRRQRANLDPAAKRKMLQERMKVLEIQTLLTKLQRLISERAKTEKDQNDEKMDLNPSPGATCVKADMLPNGSDLLFMDHSALSDEDDEDDEDKFAAEVEKLTRDAEDFSPSAQET